MRTPDDERFGQLMRAAQQGDAGAYARLLTELTPRIRRTIGHRRAGRTAADVEDLVQDVLLSVHVARASYDPARPFVPWLLAIVRNRLADGARRYARRSAHEVQVEDLDVTFAGSQTKFETGLGDGRDLRRAMATLSAGQRDAVELVKLRGLSLKEASAATGMSVGALKVATHRAIAALRRKLTAGDTHGH